MQKQDAHRDGKRFVVRADEKLTAFIELESANRQTPLANDRRSTSTALLTIFVVLACYFFSRWSWVQGEVTQIAKRIRLPMPEMRISKAVETEISALFKRGIEKPKML
jgi:hypothetical protein